MKVYPQLKPFERLFQGDAVSRQEFAGDEPGYGTLDEVERGSRRFANHPVHGERSGAGANP